METINRCASVIVPVYNSESTISRCLKALKEQSFLPLEVIVVDDGSTDRTVEIAGSQAIVISNIRRKGAGGARNTGAYAAKGEIIVFIDSDCVPPKEWLKNIAISFSDTSVIAVGGGYCSGADNNFWQRFCFEELAFRRRNCSGTVKTLVSSNFACRKSAFLEEGGFPEGYPVCEDMLLSNRMSRRGKVLWLDNNGVRHYFRNSLEAYLKHQYFFGAESTRFFLQNPIFLTVETHQGKTLHIAIMLTFFSILSVLIAIIAVLSGDFTLGRIFFIIFGLLLLSHLLLYFNFIRHLMDIKLLNIVKAYGVSFLRDAICGVSFVDGIIRAFWNRKHKSDSIERYKGT